MSTETAVANPAPAPFPFVTVRTDSGDLLLPCEPVNDWLAITPDVGMDKDGKGWLVGGFVVTHRVAGLRLTDGSACIDCCRWCGQRLAEFDWSGVTADNATEWSAALSDDDKAKLAIARGAAWRCDAEPCENDDAEEAK